MKRSPRSMEFEKKKINSQEVKIRGEPMSF